MKKKLLHLGAAALITVVTACVLFAFISTGQLNESIDLGNRKIVLNYATQIAARLHDRFEQVDISLAELRRDIESAGAMAGTALAQKLEAYADIWGIDACGLLFEDGDTRLADGSAVYLENEISLRDVLSYSEELNLSRQLIDGKDMLTFAKPCHAVSDGRTISGVFAAMKMERLAQFLGDYGYGEGSFLVLTQANGDNIWKQGAEIPDATGNCFEDLEKLSVSRQDSILQMKTRMTVAMDGTIAYSRDGLEYYMAYVPLKVNYWYLLVSAASSSIDLTELSRQHFIISAVLIAVILTMGLAGLFYMFQRNRAVTSHNEQLTKAMELANQANAAKRDFLAKVSHEIRTPLNGVIGMISLAQKNYPDRDRCLQQLKKASISADYLLNLLNDVLDMSQIESGKQRLADEVIDMARLREEALVVIEAGVTEKGLSLKIEDSGMKHRYFRGDYLRLKQIITNLVSNAVKYTPPGGHITVEVLEPQERETPGLILRVSDDGEGIPPDRLKDIFKPFEQASREKKSGVGLGLSIVKSFVELMNGRITVESEPGKGSLFSVELPLAALESPAEEKKAQTASLEGISILLAEDNQINAEIAIELLMSQGARVTRAADGEEAVNLFRSSAPGGYQVILMDIQMPKKNGMEAAREIRGLDRSDAAVIPILALTANAFKEQQEEMLQAGLNDFLYKPMNLDKVCACIRKWVWEE